MKRDKAIDIAKGIAIILMMYGHLKFTWYNMDNTYGWISSFHMPFFIYITGLLTRVKENGKWQQTVGKAKKVLLPYLIWNVAGYVALAVFQLQTQSVDLFIHGVIFGDNLNSNLPTWYLMSFFWISVFAIWILPKIDTKKGLVVALVLSVILVFGLDYCEQVTDYFRWKGTVALLPFFILGCLLKKIDFKLPWWLIPVCFYIGYKTYRLNAVASYGYVIVGSGTLGKTYLYLISATATTLAMIELCRYMAKIPVLHVFGYFGRHSLIVLCTHWILGVILATKLEYSNSLFICVFLIECIIIAGYEWLGMRRENKIKGN